MSWWTKHRNKILGTLAGPLGLWVGSELDKQNELQKQAQAEQQRAEEEAKAIAAAKGGEQIEDNTQESVSATQENKKRRGYLSTLKSQGGNSLLGAVNYSGKKTRLGD